MLVTNSHRHIHQAVIAKIRYCLCLFGVICVCFIMAHIETSPGRSFVYQFVLVIVVGRPVFNIYI